MRARDTLRNDRATALKYPKVSGSGTRAMARLEGIVAASGLPQSFCGVTGHRREDTRALGRTPAPRPLAEGERARLRRPEVKTVKLQHQGILRHGNDIPRSGLC